MSRTPRLSRRHIRSRLLAALGAALLLAAGVAATSPAEAAAHQEAQPDIGFGRALVGSAPVGVGPSELAANPRTHTIYVTNGFNVDGPEAGGDTVSVVDARRCQADDVARCAGPWPTIVVGSRTPDDRPSGVAVDLATDTVYVANFGANTVSVFDGATCNASVTSGCGQVPTEVPVGAAPFALTIDQVSGTAYIVDSGGTDVSMLDTRRCNAEHLDSCPTTALPVVDVGATPFNVDTDDRSHTAYVTTAFDHDGWAVFDTRTCNARRQSGCGTLGRLNSVSVGPNDGVVDPVHQTLFTADFANTISAFDLRHCRADDLSGCATVQPGVVTALPATFIEHDLWVAIDTATHTAYVSFHKDDAVLVVDTNLCNGTHPAGCAALAPQEIHTGANPEGIALDPRTHTLYTANEIDNTISVIDASLCNARVTRGCRTRPPSAAVPGAGAIAVDPTVQTAYVASGSNTVAMLDTRVCNAFHPKGCRRSPTTFALADGPTAIAIDPPTHTAYVGTTPPGPQTSGSVAVLDTRTCNADHAGCTVTGTLQVTAGAPTAITVNSTTGTLYVGTATSGGANGVSVFDATTCNAWTAAGCGQAAARLAAGPVLGPSPHDCGWFVGVGVNEATNTLYATNTEGCGGAGEKVFVYNGATCDSANTAGCGDALATITAGLNPTAIAVDETTNTVYAPLLADGEHAGNVAVIDGATCNGTNTSGCDQTPALAPAGFAPTSVALNPKSNRVYVTNVQDTSLSVIDGAHCNGADTSQCDDAGEHKVSVDDYPNAVAVDPQVDTAYVTSGPKGTVTVVPIER